VPGDQTAAQHLAARVIQPIHVVRRRALNARAKEADKNLHEIALLGAIECCAALGQFKRQNGVRSL
jgi:hypothetical protein